MLPILSFLLGIQHETQYVVTKLRIFETHRAEVVFGFVAQDVAAMGPERSDGFADGDVRARGVRVDVAGIGNLSLGRRVDAVNLRMRQGLQVLRMNRLARCTHIQLGGGSADRHAELPCEGIKARMT